MRKENQVVIESYKVLDVRENIVPYIADECNYRARFKTSHKFIFILENTFRRIRITIDTDNADISSEHKVVVIGDEVELKRTKYNGVHTEYCMSIVNEDEV